MAKKLEKKFIGDDQVGSSQILIEKNVSLRGTTQADSVVDLLGLNISDEVLLKGVKVLNSSGLIPADILPSYVDDILEYADLSAFPVTGETGKIYVALDTNKCYRWSGSAYIQITSGAVDSVNGETGLVVLDAGDIVMVSEPTTVESKLVSLQGEVDAVEGDVANLVTLSGVAVDSTDLGSFTGTTIPDGQTIKQALQSLEVAHEEVDQNANDLISLSGVGENSTTLGTFTGTTIPDSQTIKQALQALETAHEEVDQNANDLITLSGVAENAVNLGAFTGSTIPDDQTIKQAIQSLETAVEAKVSKAGDTMTGFLTLHADPTAPLHAATKQYVDAVAEGLHVHAPARLIAAVDLGGTYNNGTAGVGAFLDFSASPIAGIDGVSSFAAGDRIIVAFQNGSALDLENGIYYIASAGDIDGNGDITKLTRATDFDTPVEMAGGDFIFVQEGSTYADTGWVMTETVVTVGTTPVKFLQFSGAGSYSAGDALFLDGTEFNVLYDNSTIGLNGSNQLQVKTNGIGTTQIADDAVTKEKIASDVAGAGLVQNVDGSLEVNPGNGIEVVTDLVRIKLDGSTLAVSASGLKSNISWVKDLYAVTTTLTSGAFFDLDFVAEVDSISAWVDRLAIHEGASEDYTVSYTGGVGGVTRITFVNALVTPGQSQLSNGDTVYFKYQKRG